MAWGRGLRGLDGVAGKQEFLGGLTWTTILRRQAGKEQPGQWLCADRIFDMTSQLLFQPPATMRGRK